MTLTTQTPFQDLVADLWNKNSWSHVRSFLATLTTEEAYHRYIEQAQKEGMPQYADVLKRHAHKKLNTFQTAIWHAEVLFVRGEHFQAEQWLKTKMMLAAFEDTTVEQRADAVRLLSRIYGALLRFEEAKEQLTYLEQLGKRTSVDTVRLLMAKGEREEAIELILSMSPEQRAENQHHLSLFLSDLYLLEGKPEEARALLYDIRSHYPHNYLARIELVSVLYVTGDLEEAFAEMAAIHTWNPYHYAKWSFLMLEAHILYKLDRLEELSTLVKAHPTFFEKHVYTNVDMDRTGKRVQLKVTQQVQQINYCVPAALQLILQAFDVTEHQETIARAVHEDEGTQLHHAREYMTAQGFESRYFRGDIATYKSLLDQGIPILVSTLIEMNAHVQVVVGYDDRVQALSIQDPNEVHPYFLSYENWQKVYQLREGLSVAFFPQVAMAENFERPEHAFFDTLYTMTSEESTGSQEMLAFADAHPDNLSVAVMSLLSLTSQATTEQSARWVSLLEERIGSTHADTRLLKAHHAFWNGNYKEALEALRGPHFHTNSNALFIKGLSHFKMDELDEAEKAWKQSLEFNPHQAVIYSYLARLDIQREWRLRAYQWVRIAKELSPNDSFAKATEALVYFENGVYDTAYSLFEQLTVEDAKDSYALYEMARSQQFAADLDQARRLYQASLNADSTEPYAYLRLAELEESLEAKKAHLEKGIEQLPEQGMLYVELGLLEEEKNSFEAARGHYEKARTLQPEDTDSLFYLARTYFKEDRLDEAWRLLIPQLEAEDPVTMLLATSFVMSEMNTTVTKDRLVSLLEERLRKASGDDVDLYAMTYVDFATEPRYRKRVIELFAELRATHFTPELRSLEAQLHAEIGNQLLARDLFLEAGDQEVAFNQLAQLALSEGNIPAAIYYFANTLELQPYQATALEGLATISVELEDIEACKAVTAYSYEVTTDIIEFDQLLEWVDDEEDMRVFLPILDALEGRVSAKWWSLLKAQCAHIMGDSHLAESYYQKGLAEFDAGIVLYRYVEYLLETGQTNRAWPFIQQELVNQPEDSDWMALFLLAVEQKKRMPFVLRRIKKLPKIHRQTYLRHAAQHLAKSVLALSEEEAENRLHWIKLRTSQISYASRTIRLFDEAVKHNKKDLPTILSFAEFYLDAKIPDEAIALLQPHVSSKEIEVKRMLVFAYSERLAERVKSKDVKTAVRYAQQLIEEDPEDMAVYDWLAQIHGYAEQFDEAIQVISQALLIDPYNAEFLGMGWRSIQLKYDADALPHLDAYVEKWAPVMKQHTDLLLVRAVTFNDLGEGERAKELLLQIPSFTIEYTPSRFELARSEVLVGNPRKAKRLLREVLSMDDGTFEELAADDPLLVDLM